MINTKPVLQIPSDIGAHCQQVAKVLTSSRAYLDREIQQQRGWAEADGHAEWMAMFDPKEIERTTANLAQAVAFIEWLAAHGNHEAEVEQRS